MQEPQTPLLAVQFETDRVQSEEQSGDHGMAVLRALIEGNDFKVFGIPLLQGRTFRSSDNDKAPLVAVVNRTLANKHWPGAEAIGKQLRLQSATGPVQVVGVVGDCKYTDAGRRVDPGILGQSAQELVVPLSSIAPLNRPHRRIRFQGGRVDAHPLSLQ
jgi:hypothetical protein